jgi:uncharacterized membrane protein HdeD (DUF308 family)
MFIGVLLLVMGILAILEKTGVIQGSFWDYLWPVALIALGIDFLFKHSRKSR